MAHCDFCCLRVSLNKDKTLPKHYEEPTTTFFFNSHRQEVCRGSGTTRYTPDSQLPGRCTRMRSKHTCPGCGRKPMKLNQNGKLPKHNPPDGGRCPLSEANNY